MSIRLDKGMISKVELIDKLREKFSPEENQKLKLPQIIMVGDQSSGKISLLEAISGVKLPKGVNTVTRCPIVIQMRKSKNKVTRIKYNDVEKIITDTEEEIKKVQRSVFRDQLTKEPITIIVESPRLNTLTMIDLPGIIKTETKDQVTAAKEKTVEIAKFYMEQENSLIVCVLPANQDICTTTTIGLAQECNKDKSRIIVALTKLDKLDNKEETLIPDILSNKKLPVKKGFFGLIVSDDILEASIANRSKLEDKKLKSLCFWKNHNKQLGLERFESVLVKELNWLIDKTLPILRKNIYNLIQETEDYLCTFSKYCDGKELQYPYILYCQKTVDHIIDAILCEAREEIKKFPCMKEFLEKKSLLKPVEEDDTFLYFWHETFKTLYEEFKGIYIEISNKSYNSPEHFEDRLNRSRINNCSLFSSPNVFIGIVDEILKSFLEKSFKCVDKCYQFIKHLIETALVVNIEDELDSMKKDIQKYAKEVLKNQKQETVEYLTYLIDSEKSYFSQEDIMVACNDVHNTESFFPRSLVLPTFNSMTSNSLSRCANTNNDLELVENCKNGLRLKECLKKYVMGLICRLGGVIPNFIRLSLFVRFQGELHDILISKVFHPNVYPSYFNISEERNDEYRKSKATLENLQNSLMELNKFESN